MTVDWPTRDEIVDRVAEALGIDPEDEDALAEEGIVLFDGMEHAFLGVAERFEPIRVRHVERVADENGEIIMEETSDGTEGGTHRFYAVYSYARMIEICQADGMDRDEAVEYLEFNTLGAYVGEATPAILHDERE